MDHFDQHSRGIYNTGEVRLIVLGTWYGLPRNRGLPCPRCCECFAAGSYAYASSTFGPEDRTSVRPATARREVGSATRAAAVLIITAIGATLSRMCPGY